MESFDFIDIESSLADLVDVVSEDASEIVNEADYYIIVIIIVVPTQTQTHKYVQCIYVMFPWRL